jgi:hypothetical protein
VNTRARVLSALVIPLRSVLAGFDDEMKAGMRAVEKGWYKDALGPFQRCSMLQPLDPLAAYNLASCVAGCRTPVPSRRSLPDTGLPIPGGRQVLLALGEC